MADYQLTSSTAILRVLDGVLIPADSNNRDFIAYQAWLAIAGNHPAPVLPPILTPQQQFDAALANGVNTIWTTSTTLNNLYAIDSQMQFNITAESVMILTSGTFSTGATTRFWPTQSSVPMPMNLAQFKAFAMAISTYVNSLYAVLAAKQAGQTNTPWPNNQITINA